jgi:hypothetical protein
MTYGYGLIVMQIDIGFIEEQGYSFANYNQTKSETRQSRDVTE